MKIKFFLLFMLNIFSASANIVIKGVDNDKILNMIKTQIISNKNSAMDSKSISNNFKIQNDKEIINIILSSFGYFDAEIDAQQKEQDIIFDIKLNTRYKLNNLSLQYQDFHDFRSDITIMQVFDLVNIKFNSYTTTKELSAASVKIINFLKKHGFAFVEMAQPEIEINKTQKKITTIYKITLNKKIIIDNTIIKIISKKNSKLLIPFVKNRIEWQNNSIWDIEKINNTKENLLKSGLFSDVTITLSPPEPDEHDDKIAHCKAIITAKEALLRNINLGIKFDTTEKLSTSVSWTHYNIDGKGSSITTQANVSNLFGKEKINFMGLFKYNVYDVFMSKIDVQNTVSYASTKTNAYKLKQTIIKCSFWKQYIKNYNIGFGAFVENSKTIDTSSDSNNTTKFSAIGMPFILDINTTDSLLNPQRGYHFTTNFTQYFAQTGCLTNIESKTSCYIPIAKNRFQNKMLIAGYAAIGGVFHNKSHIIPRDKLFFGGGSNSIRGYGKQKLGEMSKQNTPLGGKYMIEFGIEPRIKINEHVELVAFLEAGNVFSEKFNKLFYGWGIGVRYHTILGPIRFDIAFPLSVRKNIDSHFQLYLSIGQAF